MSRIFVVPLPANKRKREKERKGQRKKERHREIGGERERKTGSCTGAVENYYV